MSITTTADFALHPETTSPERLRFFSRRHAGLVSQRRDGSLHIKRLADGWSLFRAAPAAGDLDALNAKVDAWAGSLAWWQREARDIPILDELESELHADGCCSTPTGYQVEPDGTGPDGVPSWPRVFGLV